MEQIGDSYYNLYQKKIEVISVTPTLEIISPKPTLRRGGGDDYKSYTITFVNADLEKDWEVYCYPVGSKPYLEISSDFVIYNIKNSREVEKEGKKYTRYTISFKAIKNLYKIKRKCLIKIMNVLDADSTKIKITATLNEYA